MTDSALWRKSARSGTSGCVEVAFINGRVAVRDSKHKEGPILTFTPMEWQTFLRGVRNGEFNFPVDFLYMPGADST
jgi:Domain of unknown function (DUF397)